MSIPLRKIAIGKKNRYGISSVSLKRNTDIWYEKMKTIIATRIVVIERRVILSKKIFSASCSLEGRTKDS
jgi:hypothetical protein